MHLERMKWSIPGFSHQICLSPTLEVENTTGKANPLGSLGLLRTVTMADGPLQQAPTLPGSPQPGNVKQDTVCVCLYGRVMHSVSLAPWLTLLTRFPPRTTQRRTVSFYTGDTLELMRVSVPKVRYICEPFRRCNGPFYI